MSQWDKLSNIWKFSKEYLVKEGDSWDISYEFDLAAGTVDTPTVNYLVFTFGENEEIHPTYRKINAIDLDNAIINLKIETLVNPTPNVLGTEISNKIINSNFNKENGFDFNMYDETSTLSNEGTRVPFSSTIVAERKSANTAFIEREYIAPIGGVIAVKFSNLGTGQIRVEYSSGGHRLKIE